MVALKEKTDKFNYIKIKNSCSSNKLCKGSKETSHKVGENICNIDKGQTILKTAYNK